MTRPGIRGEGIWFGGGVVWTGEVGALEDSVSRGFGERFAWEDVPRCWFQVVSGESLCLSYKVVNLFDGITLVKDKKSIKITGSKVARVF